MSQQNIKFPFWKFLSKKINYKFKFDGEIKSVTGLKANRAQLKFDNARRE